MRRALCAAAAGAAAGAAAEQASAATRKGNGRRVRIGTSTTLRRFVTAPRLNGGLRSAAETGDRFFASDQRQQRRHFRPAVPAGEGAAERVEQGLAAAATAFLEPSNELA